MAVAGDQTKLVLHKADCTRGPHAPRPLVTPIYNSSTYILESAEEGKTLSNTEAENGYIYSRWGNPTDDGASSVIADLERAAGTLLYSSGMCAITTTLLTFLKPGDHLVACRPVYGGVNSFVETILSELGVEVTWIECLDVFEYERSIKSNTKVLYGETPANPTMSILDVELFGALSLMHPSITTMVDCTFASPYLVKPITFGTDIVLHSCTKYLGGHSDIVGGAVSYRTKELGKKLSHYRILMGGCMSPFDAFLLHRGIKTLAVRMDRQCDSAMQIAQLLSVHPKIARVYYAGLPAHPDHSLAKRQMGGKYSGMIAFELQGGLEDGIKFVESLKVVVLAVSLGGVESLVCHPASMTHCDHYVSPEAKEASGITDALIRLSVGLEDVKDLIADIAQALEKI